ncbi:Basic-leucine zipper (bZIP) transcription factor family protein [Raphanus sativus]|nr:Basic-leucine zipper (bZIP) transcription factor family protein [Raphanus sativus]
MNRQAETAPFVLSTQFPCPPPPPNGQKRGNMPPPRRSSLPPLPPKRPTTTRQQTEFQNFNPGPRLPPQSPVFGSLPPIMSPAPPSWSSYQGFQSAPPVAYHNQALPQLPFTGPPTPSVSAHRRASYGDNNSAGFPSMDAMNMIYPEPMEMPVGVNYSNQGHGDKEFGIGEPSGFMDEYVTAYPDLDNIFDFSIKNDDVERITSGSSKNKRKATTSSDVSPSRSVRRKSVDCNNLNNGSSSIGIGNWMFTESQMDEIARCDTLKKLVSTDPKSVKRILTNRETSRRTQERKAQQVLDLEEMVETLEKEVCTVAAHTSIAERTKLGLEEDNKQMRIRIQEMEEQAKVANALTENYNREINRLKQKGTGEVIPNKETTMDEDMWELLRLLEEPTTDYYGFE